MIIAIIDFFRNFFGEDEKYIPLDAIALHSQTTDAFKELAKEASIALISKAFSLAEFRTYQKGKEIKQKDYYLFNIEPNLNTPAASFWESVVRKLLERSECLILVQNGSLYLADDYTKHPYVFKPNEYTGVCIDDYVLTDVWFEDKVLFLDYPSTVDADRRIAGMYSEFSKLINSSANGYLGSKVRKGKLKIPTNWMKTEQGQKDLNAYVNSQMADFMNPDVSSVLPLTSDMDYEELGSAGRSSGAGESSRETKNYVNDVFDFIAIAYGIPPSLLKGDVIDTKEAYSNFITFCLNPIAKLVQDEINRKMFGRNEYVGKSYLKIDTSNIKSKDLRDVANSIDLLMRNGAFTINDAIKAVGYEPISDDIGEKRFMTKNYDLVENFERGENIESGKADE